MRSGIAALLLMLGALIVSASEASTTLVEAPFEGHSGPWLIIFASGTATLSAEQQTIIDGAYDAWGGDSSRYFQLCYRSDDGAAHTDRLTDSRIDTVARALRPRGSKTIVRFTPPVCPGKAFPSAGVVITGIEIPSGNMPIF